jgi:hypothetical protein
MKIRSKIGSDLGPKMVYPAAHRLIGNPDPVAEFCYPLGYRTASEAASPNRRDNASRLDHTTSLGTLRNEMNRGAFLGSVSKMAKSDPCDESSLVIWGSGLSRFRGLQLACSSPSLWRVPVGEIGHG